MTVHNGRTGKQLARAAHLTARSWCVSIDAAAGWICVAFLARFTDFTLLSLRGSIDLLGSRFRPCGINTLELVTLLGFEQVDGSKCADGKGVADKLSWLGVRARTRLLAGGARLVAINSSAGSNS